MSTRRTKRRYAHELYPHPDEYEVRDLATDVPYLYAIAIGSDTWGTGWGDASVEQQRARIDRLTSARQVAYLADALHQGMSGDEAWKWAMERTWNYEGDVAYERAEHYGIDPARIKPYPCGPEQETAHLKAEVQRLKEEKLAWKRRALRAERAPTVVMNPECCASGSCEVCRPGLRWSE